MSELGYRELTFCKRTTSPTECGTDQQEEETQAVDVITGSLCWDNSGNLHLVIPIDHPMDTMESVEAIIALLRSMTSPFENATDDNDLPDISWLRFPKSPQFGEVTLDLGGEAPGPRQPDASPNECVKVELVTDDHSGRPVWVPVSPEHPQSGRVRGLMIPWKLGNRNTEIFSSAEKGQASASDSRSEATSKEIKEEVPPVEMTRRGAESPPDLSLKTERGEMSEWAQASHGTDEMKGDWAKTERPVSGIESTTGSAQFHGQAVTQRRQRRRHLHTVRLNFESSRFPPTFERQWEIARSTITDQDDGRGTKSMNTIMSEQYTLSEQNELSKIE